jgi:hypothetical protein
MYGKLFGDFFKSLFFSDSCLPYICSLWKLITLHFAWYFHDFGAKTSLAKLPWYSHFVWYLKHWEAKAFTFAYLRHLVARGY